MDSNQIIAVAASAYPDAYVLEYWDTERSKPRSNPEGGDTLAEFIARELFDTFDPDACDDDQIMTAVSRMESAVADLHSVVSTLRSLQAIHTPKGERPCSPTALMSA